MLCTGGFQTAAVIEQALADGLCDAVTIARPLIANNDLVQMFARGDGRAAKPVHLLQQVPGQRRRESARLLRASSGSARTRRWSRRSCRCSTPPPFADDDARIARFWLRMSPCCWCAGAGGASSRRIDVVVHRHRRALQVRLGRHRGTGRPALLDLARAADGLRGQAAEAARRRATSGSGSCPSQDARRSRGRSARRTARIESRSWA